MPEMAQIFTEESCMSNRRIIIYCSIIGTIFGSCLDHIRAMFWLFLQYRCFYMPEMAQIFTEESCMSNRKCSLMLTNLDHIRAMCGVFFNIFVSRCLKWLKFSLKSHSCQLGEYHSISNYLDHIRAMFGPY